MMRSSILAATAAPQQSCSTSSCRSPGVLTCVYSALQLFGARPAPLPRSSRRRSSAMSLISHRRHLDPVRQLRPSSCSCASRRARAGAVVARNPVRTSRSRIVRGGPADHPGHQRLLAAGHPLLHPDRAAPRRGRAGRTGSWTSPTCSWAGFRAACPWSTRVACMFFGNLSGSAVRGHLRHRLGHDPHHEEEGLLGRVRGGRHHLLRHPGRRRAAQPQPGALLDRRGRGRGRASRWPGSSWPASFPGSCSSPRSASSASDQHQRRKYPQGRSGRAQGDPEHRPARRCCR